MEVTKMTKVELISAMAEKAMISKKDAEKAVNALVDVVCDELGKGGSVQITGFGTFSVADRAARAGVNPKTGEKIQISARKAPVFKAGSILKKSV